MQYSNHLRRSFLILQSDSTDGLLFGSNLLSTAVQVPQNDEATNEQYLEQSLQLDVEEVSLFLFPSFFFMMHKII